MSDHGPRPPSTAVTIVRLAAAPAFLAVLATAILAAVLARIEGSRSVAVNAWLLAVGGRVLWFCWRVLASTFPAHPASAFDAVRDGPAEPPTRLPELVDMEALLLDAEWSWSGVDHGLRPLLRRIAAARLLDKHQLDLASQPDESRRILGEELWALVRPGPAAVPLSRQPAQEQTRRRSSDHRRGMPRATIRRAIEQLESL
jgi:hypothetical protein